MSSKAYLSNVVESTTLKKVQSTVLTDLSNYLKNSFGPKGSNTCIKDLNALNVYTKDGFTILKHLRFNGIIEESIKDDIETITKHVATTVGDGTTSAVMLSKLVFDELLKMLESDEFMNVPPADIISTLNSVAKEIGDRIESSAKEVTVEDIYDIALISANGNEFIAQTIRDLYEKMGMSVFIDVAPSVGGVDTTLKFYDGMTINTGYSDSCFVTNKTNNSCVVDHPEIYFFEDPIDTKEMSVLLDSILHNNFMEYIKSGGMNGKIVPTVIVSPRITRDLSSNIDTLVDYQSKLQPGNKLPFLLISDTHQVDEIQDLYKLCGAKPIHKYMDTEIYKRDVEMGMAPTPDTIKNWHGTCDQVEANSNRTKFINPSLMRDENGNFSNEYNNLLGYVQTEIDRLENDGDIKTIGLLKRRLHSLKSNLVEVNVGGITVADRDSNRHLFEDAVLNCRSAAKYGVGWGANVSGLLAIADTDFEDGNSLQSYLRDVLLYAYQSLIVDLYKTYFNNNMEARVAFEDTLKKRSPFNIRTGTFDEKVKSSIESDKIILSSVVKIIGIMVTCNQFIVPSPQHNVYTELKEIG